MESLVVVTPVFNEAETLPELIDRLTATLDAVEGVSWSVLFVDDGSRDATAAMIAEHGAKDGRFSVLRLSRNFGHQAALTAGIDHAEADAVVLMDADLQDPPEVLPEMISAWRDGHQVILAARRSRQDTGLRGLGFRLFHRFQGALTDFEMPANTGIFGLLDRRVVEALRGLTERNRFLPGLRHWVGFDRFTVYYDRQARAGGEPKQSLLRLVKYAVDGVLSFSYKPLRIMTYTGCVVSLIGFSIGGYFIAKRLLGLETADIGFTTLVTLIVTLGGMQLLAVGILGEYLARIYDEVKNRPLYVLRGDG
ncbi:MAG: glycosyltransferase family 2 protein [Planctomycetota bacterium]